MTSVFKFNIDTSEIKQAMQELGNSFSTFENWARSMTSSLEEVYGQGNRAAQAFSRIANVAARIGNIFNTSLLFPLKIITGVASGILSIFKNLLMLPFGILSKVFEGMQAAWGFFTETAEGSQRRAQTARELRTTHGNLFAFERAQDLAGYDISGALSAFHENLNNPELQKHFAGIGLNHEDLKSMDGITAFLTFMRAIQSSGMGYDEFGASGKFAALDLSHYMSQNQFRALVDESNGQSKLSEIEKFYKAQNKTYKGFEAIEQMSTRLGQAFEDVRIKLTAKFGPSLLRLAQKVPGILDRIFASLEKSGVFKTLETFADDASKSIAKFIEKPGNLENLMQTIADGIKIMIRALLWVAEALTFGDTNKKVEEFAAKVAPWLKTSGEIEEEKALEEHRRKSIGLHAGADELSRKGLAAIRQNIAGLDPNATIDYGTLHQMNKQYFGLERKEEGQQFEMRTRVVGNKVMGFIFDIKDQKQKSKEFEIARIKGVLKNGTL